MNIPLQSQLEWAKKAGLKVDANGYVEKLEANLLQPLDPEARASFARGSGSELTSKMLALHSSSALVVNVFAHWCSNDAAPLAAALELPAPIVRIEFESQHPTGLPGNPPNLDVCLLLADGHTVAIESKFGEWLTRKIANTAPFKSKYFETEGGAWASLDMPRCETLAKGMRDGQVQFEYLDAAQLLKHALGMGTPRGSNFALVYLYYEWEVPQARKHRDELERFASLVDQCLRFRALSYQNLFAALAKACERQHEHYISYLHDRYFAVESRSFDGQRR